MDRLSTNLIPSHLTKHLTPEDVLRRKTVSDDHHSKVHSTEPPKGRTMWDKLLLGVALVYFVHFIRSLIRYVSHISYQHKMVKDMPGPETWPLLGCLPSLPRKKSDFAAFFLEESRKAVEAGHGVMKLWLGPRLVIFPLDGESAKSILNSSTEIKKGEVYTFLGRWLGGGLVTASPEKWHKGRRILTPVFHFEKLQEYGHAMDFHCRRLISVLTKQADGKSVVDMHDLIKRASLDMIADAGMGIKLDSLSQKDQPYCHAIDNFGDLCFLRTNYFYLTFSWIWKALGYEKRTQDVLHTLKSMTKYVVATRMSALEKEGIDTVDKKKLDFLDLLLQLQAEGTLTTEEVCEQVDTFMFAGHDTTAHGLTWIIWCLATNPNIQEKLYKEVEQFFGGSDQEFHTPKVKQLKYLNAVIKESMRVYAPIPMVERQLQNDLVMDGFKLPRGTFVKISPFIIHHNHKVYENHWDFNPERFVDAQPPTSYFPFSWGPRNCIGQKFALQETQTTLCHLIHNFRFSTDHKMRDNGVEFSIVLKPTLGCPVTVSRRN